MKQLIIVLLLSFTGILFGQESNIPNVDELHNRKWEFIVEKAKLSSQEAARVKPFFLEYEKAVWSLMERN